MGAQHRLLHRSFNGPPQRSTRATFALICIELWSNGSCNAAAEPTCVMPPPAAATAKSPRSQKQRCLLQKSQSTTMEKPQLDDDFEPSALGERAGSRPGSTAQQAELAVAPVVVVGSDVIAAAAGSSVAPGADGAEGSGSSPPAPLAARFGATAKPGEARGSRDAAARAVAARSEVAAADAGGPAAMGTAETSAGPMLLLTQLQARLQGELQARLKEPSGGILVFLCVLLFSALGMLVVFTASIYRGRDSTVYRGFSDGPSPPSHARQTVPGTPTQRTPMLGHTSSAGRLDNYPSSDRTSLEYGRGISAEQPSLQGRVMSAEPPLHQGSVQAHMKSVPQLMQHNQLCPKLVVPRSTECILAVPTSHSLGGPLPDGETFDVSDFTGKPVLRISVRRPDWSVADSQMPIISLRGLHSMERDAPPMLLAYCKVGSETEQGFRCVNVYNAKDEFFAQLCRDPVRQLYVLTSIRAGVKMVFGGDFQRHRTHVISPQGDHLADTAPEAVGFDLKGSYYKLRVVAGVDTGMVLCGLLSVELMELY